MKSMKQIADELSVTKMTVYNNAKKANVKFQKIDNVNYLSTEDENIVIKRIKKNKNDGFENANKEQINDNNLVKDETIKHLYKQLEIYKEQANRDKEQINTLNRLLENQQILALESNKKIEQLENKLEKEKKLNYSFDCSSKGSQNSDSSEEMNDENINENLWYKGDKLSKEIKKMNEEKQNSHKKGIWSRLFRR